MNSQAVGRLAEIEQAIVDSLKPLLPDFIVQAYPDDPSSYDLMHNKGAVLVVYRGKQRLADSEAFCGYVESNCLFNVFVKSRHLRARDAHQGVYDALEAIEGHLEGWQPDNVDSCGAFEFVQDGYVQKDENTFIYNALFRTQLVGL